MSDPGGGHTLPAWNKGLNVGQKRALTPQQVKMIRSRLRSRGRVRDLALFNLAIDSKLLACDLVCLEVIDVWYRNDVRSRVQVPLQRSGKSFQFEMSAETKAAVADWVSCIEGEKYLFPSRFHKRPHLSVRQYARIVSNWVAAIGLDPNLYGTESLRRTKALLILQQTGNLKAAQLLLGHAKLETTARFFETELGLRIFEKIKL